MNTTIGSSQTSKAQVTVDDLSRQYYFTRFVSEGLNQPSISANTWTYNFSAKAQPSAPTRGNFPVDGNDKSVRVVCYVWRPGTGKIGDILDGNSAATVDEPSDNIEVSHHVTFSGSAVSSIQNGDVIAFEVWFVIDPLGGATPATMTFYYDGTTVNTTDNSTVSNHASFIETPENLAFLASSGNMTNSNTKTYSNKFITKV